LRACELPWEEYVASISTPTGLRTKQPPEVNTDSLVGEWGKVYFDETRGCTGGIWDAVRSRSLRRIC